MRTLFTLCFVRFALCGGSYHYSLLDANINSNETDVVTYIEEPNDIELATLARETIPGSSDSVVPATIEKALEWVHTETTLDFVDAIFLQYPSLSLDTLPAGISRELRRFTKFWLNVRNVDGNSLQRLDLTEHTLKFKEKYSIDGMKAIKCLWAMRFQLADLQVVAKAIALQSDFSFVSKDMLNSYLGIDKLLTLVMSDPDVYAHFFKQYQDSPPHEILKTLPHLNLPLQFVEAALVLRCFKAAIMSLNKINFSDSMTNFRFYFRKQETKLVVVDNFVTGNDDIEMQLQPVTTTCFKVPAADDLELTPIDIFKSHIANIPEEVAAEQDVSVIKQWLMDYFNGQLEDVLYFYLRDINRTFAIINLLQKMFKANILNLNDYKNHSLYTIIVAGAHEYRASKLRTQQQPTEEEMANVFLPLTQLQLDTEMVQSVQYLLDQSVNRFTRNLFDLEQTWKTVDNLNPASLTALYRMIKLLNFSTYHLLMITQACEWFYVTEHQAKECMCQMIPKADEYFESEQQRMEALAVAEQQRQSCLSKVGIALNTVSVAFFITMIVTLAMKLTVGYVLAGIYVFLGVLTTCRRRRHQVN